MKNILTSYTLTSATSCLLGVLLVVFALKGFMIPNHFLDGGIMGLSLLIHEMYHFSVVIPLVILNSILIYIAYYKVSKEIALRSIIAISLLIIFFLLIPFPVITSDKLLISLFGGALIGSGIGLVIRSGAVVDGMEIIAVLTTKKIGITLGEVILGINSIIFLVAAIQFGIEICMYAMITYYTATKATDYVVDGIEEFTALTIIGQNQDAIKEIIVNDYKKGITIYKGERGYLPGTFDVKNECDIIVTIVTRLELLSIKNAIKNADPEAFMYVYNIKETSGGIIKKKNH